MDSSDESRPVTPEPDVDSPVQKGVLSEKVIDLNLATVSITSFCKPGNIENIVSQFIDSNVPAIIDLIETTTLSDDSINILNMATQTSSSELCVSAPSAKRRRDVFPKPSVSLPTTFPNDNHTDRRIQLANRSKTVTFTLQNKQEDIASPSTVETTTAMEEEADSDADDLLPVMRHRIATEATQTPDLRPDEVVILPQALPIWLLSKKHRSFEQRARLRARLLTSCLRTSITPRWALRKDQEPRPQYIENTAGMLTLMKRHAREVTEQARDDLEAKSQEEGQRADDYLSITHGIYAKAEDANSFKAEARIVEIMSRYKVQERKKLDSSFLKDKETFPITPEEWEKTYTERAQPGSSKRRRSSRSASREKRRSRPNSNPRQDSPARPPRNQDSARNAPRSDPAPTGGKGKASAGSHVKGASKRPDFTSSSSSSTSSNNHQNRARDDTRGQRGRGSSRGRGRGRGGYQENRNERLEITPEERSLFDKMKEFMSKHK